MGIQDVIVIAVLAAIIGFAVWYVCRSKKSGKKCIGCPGGCCNYQNGENCNCGSKSENIGCCDHEGGAKTK